jgi:hypothetical protein
MVVDWMGYLSTFDHIWNHALVSNRISLLILKFERFWFVVVPVYPLANAGRS